MRIASIADVASTVRGRRIDLGWSQDDLAARVGVSRKTINEIEVGRSAPRMGHLLAIFDALGLAIQAIPVSDAPIGQDGIDLDEVLKDYRRG
jgi:DNA-binding XRE family transcriptional regulator